MKPYRLLVLLAASVAAHALAADPLRIDPQPVFNGSDLDARSMIVTLENDGPDAKGALRVVGNGTATSYPVELPHGARKRVLTMNSDPNAYFVRFVLDTDQGTAYQTFAPDRPVPVVNSIGSVVMIGDEFGALSFLHNIGTGKEAIGVRDLYVAPEDAPARTAPYSPYNAVVLGPGADRMSDATVGALKDYAMGGGTLVFLGNSSATALGDARWADVLPGKDWRPKRVAPHSALATLGGVDAAEPFTVLEPASVAVGATKVEDGEGAFERQRGLGLGRVVVFGYSPLQAPLDAWEGRVRALSLVIRNGNAVRSHQLMEHYLNQGLNGVQTYQYGSPPGGTSSATDPFSTKLPPTGTVFGLLAGYFVLVVPVSFLILRKLKRGELAWVTAPLLSLGFAGALFKSAESLYAAKLSTGSQGVIVLQEGQPQAMFYGTSQMFFPHGGSYDLGLRNVDSLTSVRHQDDFGSSALADFDPVDDGRQVTVPSLEANNLAFREMSYSQRLSGDWFRIDALDAKNVRVENHSPYAFEGSIATHHERSARFNLSPGRTLTIGLQDYDANAQAPTGLPITDPHNFTKDGQIVLAGQINGFRPGPMVGVEVRNGIDVLAFAQEKTL